MNRWVPRFSSQLQDTRAGRLGAGMEEVSRVGLLDWLAGSDLFFILFQPLKIRSLL